MDDDTALNGSAKVGGPLVERPHLAKCALLEETILRPRLLKSALPFGAVQAGS